MSHKPYVQSESTIHIQDRRHLRATQCLDSGR